MFTIENCGEITTYTIYNVPIWRYHNMEEARRQYVATQGYALGAYAHWLHTGERLIIQVRHGDTYHGRWAAMVELYQACNDALGPHGLIQPDPDKPELVGCTGGWGHDPRHGIRIPGVWLYTVRTWIDGQEDDTPRLDIWELEVPVTWGMPQVAILAQAEESITQFYKRIGWSTKGVMSYPQSVYHDQAKAAWRPVELEGGPLDGSSYLCDTRTEKITPSMASKSGATGAYIWTDNRERLRWLPE